MYKFTLISVLGLLLNLCVVAQTIPPIQGKTDTKGKRQGPWVIWYDEAWNETQDAKQVRFYRDIHYKDDLPNKPVQDFYSTGVVQMRGVLLQDRPKPVYDGWISFYYENGKERLRVKHDHGKFVNEFFAFRRDGSPVTLPWDEPVVKAEAETDNQKRIALLVIAKENAEALFADKSLQFAERNEALGYEYIMEDDYQSAATAFQIARSLFIKHLPGNDIRIADMQYFYSLTLSNLKKKNEEEKVLLELLDNIDKNHAGNSNYLVNVLSSLGSLYEQNPQKAFQYLARGFDVVKTNTVTEESYPEAVSLLYNFQSNLFDLKDWKTALGVTDFTLVLIEKWEGKSSDKYINTLETRSAVERNLGRGKSSKESVNEQFELAQKTFSKNDIKYAEALVTKASAEAGQGNYSGAENMLLEAKSIYEIGKDTSRPAYGTLLNTLITIYHELGKEDKETEVEEEYKNFIITNDGFDSFAFVTYLQMRALHMINLKGYQVAEEALLVSSKIINKMDSLQLEAPELIADMQASNYSAFAMLYLYMYQDINNLLSKGGTADQKKSWNEFKDQLLERVEYYLEESIALERGTTKGIDKQTQLILLNMMSGDAHEAERVAIEMQEQVKNLFGEDDPTYSDILITRAQISTKLGKYPQASEFYRKAFFHYKNYSNSVVPYLSESERQMFFTEINSKLQQFTAFVMDYQNMLNPEEKGALLEAMMMNKSLGLNQLKDIRTRLEAAKDVEGLKLLDQWKGEKEKLIKLYQADKTVEVRQKEKILENEINQLERNMASRSKEFSTAQTIVNATWQDLQKSLKAGEVLIEILRTRIQRAVVDTSYVAVILRYGDAYPDVIEIPHAIKLEGKPLRYHQNAIRVQLEDRLSYQSFWAPVKPAIKSAKKVYLSPDGLYNQINLETLFNPATKKYLTDEIELEIITSSKQILKSRMQNPIKEVVMIGNPDFGGIAKAGNSIKDDYDRLNRAFDPENVTDLPGTKEEIDGLAGLMNQVKIKYQSFTLAEASEATIRQLQSPQVLHLATHGFFLSDVTSEGDDYSIMGFEKKKLIDNPMLRSGLLLAGCRNGMKNRNENSDALTDGILTAYEVTNLDLSNTQLVVMSACETGLGKIMNGEGVIGLPRAFLSAGAKGVLMSLWKVDDEATQEIMREFYKKWIELGNKEAAWRRAQQSLRLKYPSPYYWGAFVMLR